MTQRCFVLAVERAILQHHTAQCTFQVATRCSVPSPLQAQVSCLNKRSSGKWIQCYHDWTVGISVSCPCQSVAVWSWCRAGEEQGEFHQASCDTLARDGKENNRGGRAESCNVRKSRVLLRNHQPEAEDECEGGKHRSSIQASWWP